MAGPSDAALEDALDFLIDAGLVDERGGGLVTTEAFESTRRVYRDSYAAADDAVFRRTVADVFGVDEETAAERIDAGAVTRDDLIAYLSLRSALDSEASKTPRKTGEAGDSEERRSSGNRTQSGDSEASKTPWKTGEAGDSAEPRSASNRTQSDDDDIDDEHLATMATLVAELSPGSPVPATLDELDDESWRAFLDDHPDTVVTVWRHDCAPCEALKEDLDDVLDVLPDGVAVAGVDGESVPAFRRTFDVDTAPAVCCFRGGDLVDTVTGRQSPDAYADRFAELY